MSLPTLLKPGYIVPPRGMSAKDKKILSSTISIDYILNFLGDRIPLSNQQSSIKKKPKKYGDKVLVLKSDTGSEIGRAHV